MPRQFDGASCIFCPNASTRTGEHVLPRWFVRGLFAPGEYGWLVNRIPVPKRDGSARTHVSFGSFKLPCCEFHNGTLNYRFESSKSTILRLFDSRASVILEASEAEDMGLWLLKTWLLLSHPRADPSEPGINLPHWDLTKVGDVDLYRWMVTDESPPSGLSLWVSRVSAGSIAQPSRSIELPTVITDGRTISFQVSRWAVNSVEVTLLYHPGWEIDYPLEKEGTAIRVWPPNYNVVDLAALDDVDPSAINWVEGADLHFRIGAYPSGDLPPLGSDTKLLFAAIPGVSLRAAPRLVRSN